MNIQQQIVILSGELSTLTQLENIKRTINLEACLEDMQFNVTKVIGCYEGTKENSFMVIVNDNADITVLKDYAFKNFGQDSILHQDSNGLCHLEFNDGGSKTLGKFHQVNPKYIDTLESYTIINNRALTIK